MNIGIIGLGKMGKNHLTALNHIRNNQKTSKYIHDIYMFDTNFYKMEELKALYQAKPCGDVAELSQRSDAVILAAPTCAHFKIANYLCEQGKDMLIEKPITATVQEAEALIRSLKENVVCMVGHIEQFNPAVLYLKDYLQGKCIHSISAERISLGEPGRCFDVDAVRDLMIHDIDIILSIVGGKISGISAAAHSKELNDVVAILHFENNITADLKVNRMDFKRSRKLHVTTDCEHIDLDFLNRSIDFHRAFAAKYLSQPRYPHDIAGSKETLYLNGDSLRNELLYFLSCVEERKTPFTNAQTAAMALETANHILAAL